jgi:hypothetical protein
MAAPSVLVTARVPESRRASFSGILRWAERITAGVAFAAVAPALGATMAAVRLLSGRSPLIAHRRVGLNGELFWILKVRTMWGQLEELPQAPPGWRARPARHQPSGWVLPSLFSGRVAATSAGGGRKNKPGGTTAVDAARAERPLRRRWPRSALRPPRPHRTLAGVGAEPPYVCAAAPPGPVSGAQMEYRIVLVDPAAHPGASTQRPRRLVNPLPSVYPLSRSG